MPNAKLEPHVTRARMFHFVHTLSALHHGDADHFLFEGDPVRGRSFLDDGCGNHVTVGWNEAGIVACGFEHEFVRLEDVGEEIVQEFWDAFPDSLRGLGQELAAWKPPVNGAAWFDADGIGGRAENQDRVKWLRETDEAKLLSYWADHHLDSPERMELARSLALATSSGRHRLTDAEIAVALATPGGHGAPNASAIAAAKKHFAAAGVDWL
jgi:hypothetical protein